MMGPVHENDTSASVNAIKNMLSSPVVLLALLSTVFVHDDGRVSSKPPRKDAPKRSSSRKKKRLKPALVDKALSALAPNMAVTASPNVR